MSADHVEAEIDRHGFLGFKPYRFYARSGDAVNCGITEFMLEHQIAVAHRRGLLIMMHVLQPRRHRRSGECRRPVAAVRDVSQREMDSGPLRRKLFRVGRSRRRLAAARPAQCLAMMSRRYAESDAMDAAPVGRRALIASCTAAMMFRSASCGAKYVAFGRAWAYLSETNHSAQPIALR